MDVDTGMMMHMRGCVEGGEDPRSQALETAIYNEHATIARARSKRDALWIKRDHNRKWGAKSRAVLRRNTRHPDLWDVWLSYVQP